VEALGEHHDRRDAEAGDFGGVDMMPIASHPG
jgi:hypothetical protein